MDVFSGIGGFSLGLKRAGGFRTVAYCEIDSYCQKVLQARMLDGSLDTAAICTDIRRLAGQYWAGRVDLICGGFPCQDISIVGKRAGIDGKESGLWRELARMVREVHPRWVLVENVPALLTPGGGFERVLGDLAESGYDAEWDCIPASAFGAPHIRERVWIVAYPQEQSQREQAEETNAVTVGGKARDESGYRCSDMADAGGIRLEGDLQAGNRKSKGGRIFQGCSATRASLKNRAEQWGAEPAVGRVAHGVPDRVDRLSSLGNTVLPQIVEWIGLQIMKAELERKPL